MVEAQQGLSNRHKSRTEIAKHQWGHHSKLRTVRGGKHEWRRNVPSWIIQYDKRYRRQCFNLLTAFKALQTCLDPTSVQIQIKTFQSLTEVQRHTNSSL